MAFVEKLQKAYRITLMPVIVWILTDDAKIIDSTLWIVMIFNLIIIIIGLFGFDYNKQL